MTELEDIESKIDTAAKGGAFSIIVEYSIDEWIQDFIISKGYQFTIDPAIPTTTISW